MDHLHGILFTGGYASKWTKDALGNRIPSHYMNRVKFIMDYAEHLNDNGRHFFLYGTCLGHQSMITKLTMSGGLKYVGNHDKEYEVAGDVQNETDFTNFFPDLSVFQDPVYYFNHKYAYEWTKIERDYPDDLEPIMKKNVNGYEIASVVQFKKYPFYTFLYHIEKDIEIPNAAMDDKRY